MPNPEETPEEQQAEGPAATARQRVKFPLVQLPKGKEIDLTGFDLDDLLT